MIPRRMNPRFEQMGLKLGSKLKGPKSPLKPVPQATNVVPGAFRLRRIGA